MGQKRPPSAAGESGLPFFSSHLCLSQGSIWGGGQLSLASQGACPPSPPPCCGARMQTKSTWG